MIRRVIQIDENKCNGCGACASACHEGAIAMVDGVAKLMRDDYCDGLGDCLPSCNAGAISFIEREALAYDEVAVQANIKDSLLSCECLGSHSQIISNKEKVESSYPNEIKMKSYLFQWPIQIKLVPITAPYFENANLLVAADCSAFAYADFHQRFIKNHITLIGCPKLDEGDYTNKLTQIIKQNKIKSLSIVKMEVPCCKGIENAAITALKNSGKFIPWNVITISINGEIVD